MERIIGEYGDPASSVLIVCVAGMHGNEPAGIKAAQDVISELKSLGIHPKAHILALLGNIKALAAGQRYLDEDLNRIWCDTSFEKIKQGTLDTVEMHELAELYQILAPYWDRPYSQKIFIDLHTTSAHYGSFLVATDYISTARFTQELKIPIVLGLEAKLENTAIEFLKNKGFASMAIEGGQHQSPKAIRYLKVFLWHLVYQSGSVPYRAIPPEYLDGSELAMENRGVPGRLELAYLHKIQEGDEFVMEPGFQNFDPVQKGQILARDRRGSIRALTDGYILMPLYQKSGDDGFFLVQT